MILSILIYISNYITLTSKIKYVYINIQNITSKKKGLIMNVQITKTKELNQMLDEKKMHVTNTQNGILNIRTSNGDNAAMQNISSVLSQILTDNRDLSLITLNIRNEEDGTCSAIATFISFIDIAFAMKDPGTYAYSHGISRICPPFM